MLPSVIDAVAALREMWTPPFRAVAAKILGLTLALVVMAAAAAHAWLSGLVTMPSPWLGAVVAILEGLGLAVAGIFLVAPMSALVAGFFIDDLAGLVEHDIDPAQAPGRALPIGTALWLSVRFALLSLAVMIVALALLLVPGINAIAFLGANAYLSGRQYFEFAALRFRSPEETRAMRNAHAGTIFAAGLWIALFLSVPILNLLTPLFATALMVRVHKRLALRQILRPR
ncbi:sulfate transporter family protein [Lichenihabitans psoromatis]|uniref:sulfate transporter family protein n=1 Tax=Lichenihabitans psoromatis TaxID=2528642 RepID=UPI001038487A|nr:sulfate transporter family protein [Lichenihabitans psoromatis]